ncbi:MAG TPA: CbtA family protein, partial [Pseudonocardiaceae bacterium]|nr:CbtA family protein [Pseudonocardiaceae bacterium]
AVIQFLLPTINEIPDAFPATVLWEFRVAALGTQLVMWATIGLLFGALVARAFTNEAAQGMPARR